MRTVVGHVSKGDKVKAKVGPVSKPDKTCKDDLRELINFKKWEKNYGSTQSSRIPAHSSCASE